MSTRSTYDYSISITRVIAMLFIVVCHLGSHFGSPAVGELFNVGVPMFFVISGYLYGNRKIDRPGVWLFKRYLRLEVPLLLWLLLFVVGSMTSGTSLPRLHECVFLLLNLQGLDFIFPRIEDLFIGPWFFTSIMCCYLLLLCYQRVRAAHPRADRLFARGGCPYSFVKGSDRLSEGK